VPARKKPATKQLPKKARTRLALLRAAVDLLGHEDGRHTRVDDIVLSVGMTRTTFYNYFVSREEIFDVVAFELSHHFNSALLPIVNLESDDAYRTGYATRYYLEKAQHDRKWGWAMVNVSLNSPKLFGEETYNEASRSIFNGTATKVFNLVNPEAGRDLLLGTILTAFLHILHRNPDSSYIDEITTIILRGLGVPAQKAKRIATNPLHPLPPFASPFSGEA
jgi:AcrR family transcriptional regulator